MRNRGEAGHQEEDPSMAIQIEMKEVSVKTGKKTENGSEISELCGLCRKLQERNYTANEYADESDRRGGCLCI